MDEYRAHYTVNQSCIVYHCFRTTCELLKYARARISETYHFRVTKDDISVWHYRNYWAQRSFALLTP